MKYDIDYFIDKFSNIPEGKWARLQVESEDGRHCTLGLCGTRIVRDGYEFTEEGWALCNIFGGWQMVTNFNDIEEFGGGKTPKERILNQLYKLKKKEDNEKLIKFAEELINENLELTN